MGGSAFSRIYEIALKDAPHVVRVLQEAMRVEAEKTIVRDPNRCAVCGWTLAATMRDGCVRGNCSMRPRPVELYDAKRAEEEAGRRS